MHYQWNMNILPASLTPLTIEPGAPTSNTIGITSADVGIKVNSRKVMARTLEVVRHHRREVCAGVRGDG